MINEFILGYRVERLNKTNLEDLASLHKTVYRTIPGKSFFQKKYATAYTGVENVGYIAYTDKLPVAYYGVIPCFIQFENKIVLSAQSVDAMTHPRYRKKGLFMKLSDITHELCLELGIKLVFGFPNQKSYPIMISRLNWIETEKMKRFEVPVNIPWTKKLFKSSKRSLTNELDKMQSPQMGISNSVIRDGNGGVYRSNDYLQYKTFSNSIVLKLGSADIWIKVGNELVIGDILLKGRDDDFFEEIKELARKLQIRKISFQVSNGCDLHDRFTSRYEAVPSFPVLFRDLGSGVQLNKIKFTFADIDIF